MVQADKKLAVNVLFLSWENCQSETRIIYLKAILLYIIN